MTERDWKREEVFQAGDFALIAMRIARTAQNTARIELDLNTRDEITVFAAAALNDARHFEHVWLPL